MTTAVIIPGSMTSIANCCVPVDFARLSSRGSFSSPMILKAAGSLSLTSVGTACCAALPASSPKVAFLPAPRATPRPRSRRFRPPGRSTAAPPPLPAWRAPSRPPGAAAARNWPWRWSRRWPGCPCRRTRGCRKVGTWAGALSTRICSQDASSSSATMAGKPGPHALARLDVLADHGNGVVRSMRTNGIASGPAAAAAPPPAPGRDPHAGSTHAEGEPRTCERGQLQELAARELGWRSGARGRCGLLDVTQIHDAVLIEAVSALGRASAA